MKRIAILAGVLLALLAGAPAHALGPLGTLPIENEDTGSFAVGGGYLHREVRMVPKKTGFSAITASQNLFYAEATEEAFGWEWAGRLGIADFSDGRQFDAGYKPFAGLGLKGYLYGNRSDSFGLTAAFRADVFSRYKIAGVTVGPALSGNVRVKDLWEAEAGLMVHRRLDRLTVYGGPVIRYIEGKVYRTTSSGNSIQDTDDSYYENQTVGGLAGGIAWQHDDKRFGLEAGASSGGYSIALDAAVGF